MAYPLPLPIYNWTGFYVGANLGGAWVSGTLSDSFTGGSVSASSSGVIGGGQFGYNFQNGNFVFGAELVFDGTSLDASGSAGPLSATAKTNWVTTLAARFGWAASNNWLWYGKAGGGWAHNEATVTNWCRPKCGWNYKWHNLRETNYSTLCGEFKWLIDGLCGKALPAIDFAHVDLAGSKQRPEQHGSRVRRRQHGLRLDPALELLV